MEPTALYKLIMEAKSKNKAVQLLMNNNPKDGGYDLIIEPEHEIQNLEGNILSFANCLVDLDFIACAVIIDNHKERAYAEQRAKIKSHRRMTNGEMYPLKPEGKVYVGNG